MSVRNETSASAPSSDNELYALSFLDVLSRELAIIRRGRALNLEAPAASDVNTELRVQNQAPEPGVANPEDGGVVREAHAARLVGLAFSGGGIRSATFNLGVLQARSINHLLRRPCACRKSRSVEPWRCDGVP